MKMLFIDPATIATGWALFIDGKLHAHGSITARGDTLFKRLSSLWTQYNALANAWEPDEVIFERMNHLVSYKVLWSVGVIGAALQNGGAKTVHSDKELQITPGTWQKAVGWKFSDSPILAPHRDKVKSLDELAAISMGLYWYGRKI